MTLRQRNYQIESRRAAMDAWRRGERGYLICAPTGAGKSLVFSKTAEEWHRNNGGHVLILAWDNRELVLQAYENLKKHTRLSVGVEMSGRKVDRDHLPDVVCASVQTMIRRLDDFPPGTFSLLVFDEADHSVTKTWKRIRDHFWSARILGCTATPARHDGIALSSVFSSAHQAATHRELIAAGQMSRIRQESVRVLDLSAVVMPPGADIDPETLGKVMEEERHLHVVVEPILRLSEDRSTIVFAATVDHAKKLALMFERYRTSSARVVWGSMPRDDRKEILEAFKERRFQFLINIAVLGRGVDYPFVSCIAMARPTQSRTLYEHAIGRGWRSFPGKQDLLVLDFCGNAERLRLVNVVDVLGGTQCSEDIKERARERLGETKSGDVLSALDGAAKDLLNPITRARIRAITRFRLRRVNPLDIQEVDWAHKNNREISQETGWSLAYVQRIRPKDQPSPSLRKPKADDFAGVDWNHKSNQCVMQETGWSKQIVRRFRPADQPSPARASSELGRKWRSNKTREVHMKRPEEDRKEAARKGVITRGPDWWKASSPEQRHAAAQKRSDALSPERKREIAKKANAVRTPEEKREAHQKRLATLTPDRRHEIATRRWSNMSPEQKRAHSEGLKAFYSNLTPEERRERAQRGIEKRSQLMREKWKSLSSQERAELQKKMHEAFEARSEEKKEITRQKHRKELENRTPEERSSMRLKSQEARRQNKKKKEKNQKTDE